MLSQIGEDEEEHPATYASRKLKPSESRYSAIERVTCLAAVWALKHFEHYSYLYGQPFILVTDHRLLTWLKTMKNSNQRLTRWAVFLQQFKMDIQHRPGSQQKNAGLSRGGRDVTEPAKCSLIAKANTALNSWCSPNGSQTETIELIMLLLNPCDCLQFCYDSYGCSLCIISRVTLCCTRITII